MKTKDAKVRVYVRIRPLMHEENASPEDSCVRTTSDKVIELMNWRDVDETVCYEFEQVFPEESSQDEVFCTTVTSPIMQFLELRQNTSILVYGPTGSGKTYTLLGTNDEPGIIPRAMQSLFRRIRKISYAGEETVTLKMSYLEVYCEKVIDLLNSDKSNLPIQADKSGNIIVPGLTEIAISNFDSFENIFIPASENRSVGCTKLNARSSRSHCILMIQLQYQSTKNPNIVQVAKLNFVDLAGSEDNRRTGNTGKLLKESGAINTSLHVFKKVVDALNPKFSGRIPYRESKLTRLLQDSLGGSSHTSLIINVAPEMSNIHDTTSALNFALKGKSVINKPFTREIVVEDNIVLTPAKSEVESDKIHNNPPAVSLITPFLKRNASHLDEKLINRLVDLEKMNLVRNTSNVPSSPYAVQCIRSHEVLLQSIRKSAKKLKALPGERNLIKEVENDSSTTSSVTSFGEICKNDENVSPCEATTPVENMTHTEIVHYKDYITSPKLPRLGKNGRVILAVSKEKNKTVITVKPYGLDAQKMLNIINTSDRKKLLKLRHIGSKRANMIERHLTQNGKFKDLSQLESLFSKNFVTKMLQNQ